MTANAGAASDSWIYDSTEAIASIYELDDMGPKRVYKIIYTMACSQKYGVMLLWNHEDIFGPLCL
jgi:hypothetical protein